MNVVVCVKQVPDTTEIKIDPVTNTLMREGVPSILNTFDTYALEAALRLKDADKSTKVTVISMGLPKAKDVLKEALSVGADEAFLVSDRPFGGADTLATSYTLTRTIQFLEERKGEKFDIIFCGKQAIDGDTAQVGPEIAEHMGYAQVTYATEVELENGKAIVRKDTDDGYCVLAAQLPCVISVTKAPYELRFATIKGKLKANRTEIETLTNEVLQIEPDRIGLKGSPTKVKKSFTPELKKAGIVLSGDDPGAMGTKLVGMLRDAKVL